MSAIAGCMPRTLRRPMAFLRGDLIEPLFRPKLYYRQECGLIELENTHNMHSGTVYPTDVSEDICDRAHDRGIPVHLDGARIFNAAAALQKSVAELTRKFDSVMFCLSKGLGAPVRFHAGRLAGVYRQGADRAETSRRRNATSGCTGGCRPRGPRRVSQNSAHRSRKRALRCRAPVASKRDRHPIRRRSRPTS